MEIQQQSWRPVTRVLFRFCFVYFALYCLAGQITTALFPIPKIDIPDPSSLWPVRQIIIWIAAHVFKVTSNLVVDGSGSGDKTFDWVLNASILFVAVLATAIWSYFARNRTEHATLYKWFRLFIRFALAGQMLTYGFVKAIPLQMQFPSLHRLLQPFGDFSPMGILWESIGASPTYEFFAGCAEILGGLLLFFPRTTTFGALVCLADMIQVFMLNMTYDVPVKLLSFHLILLSLFLLAPDFQRLNSFFFLNQPTPPSNQAPFFRTPRANRIVFASQMIFALWLVVMNAYGSWQAIDLYGSGSPRSPLYGIWNIKTLSLDGQVRSPLLTDYDRWQRATFDRPRFVSFQRMDGSLVFYSASFDKGNLTLSKGDDKKWKAHFLAQRTKPNQLVLDGDFNGHKMRMELELFDRNKFLLVRRGFNWIQEYPFNR